LATTGPASEGGGRRLADASASVLVAAGIRKDYGDRTALRGVDLRLERGEIVVLFGANGAGKTTLLRILAGLTRPDAGQVSIVGRRMSGRGGARRLVGFAGHQTLLYNDLTARENLAFYARLYGIKDADRRIGPALERAGLADRADRRARTLSHGMQKRLALARAILHEPPVLLLDEPESGLDAASVAALGELLREWAAAGKTALLTTHSTGIGRAWAHRALRLAGGRLAGDDAPAPAMPAPMQRNNPPYPAVE